MKDRPDKGLDLAQNTKRIVDIATGQRPKAEPQALDTRNYAAVALAVSAAERAAPRE